MQFRIEARGEAREVYVVDADTVEQARAMFDAGEITKPEITEVEGIEIVSIEEDTL